MCEHQENRSYSPWYITKEVCITIPTRHTVANTIYATPAQHTMGRVDVILSNKEHLSGNIPIASVFYSMVSSVPINRVHSLFTLACECTLVKLKRLYE